MGEKLLKSSAVQAHSIPSSGSKKSNYASDHVMIIKCNSLKIFSLQKFRKTIYILSMLDNFILINY